MDVPALLKFRKEKDQHWKEDTQSPLTDEQKRKFKGLNYFEPRDDYYFELELDKAISDVGKEVIVKTTQGDQQIYLKAGKVKFEVKGKPVEAIVFEDPKQEQYQYYLLFKDKTTGRQTYKNGRMLQIDPSTSPSTMSSGPNGSGQGKVKLIVDFNYAYNPYSSYNDNWDCPITPGENYLPVPIKAGEKKF